MPLVARLTCLLLVSTSCSNERGRTSNKTIYPESGRYALATAIIYPALLLSETSFNRERPTSTQCKLLMNFYFLPILMRW